MWTKEKKRLKSNQSLSVMWSLMWSSSTIDTGPVRSLHLSDGSQNMSSLMSQWSLCPVSGMKMGANVGDRYWKVKECEDEGDRLRKSSFYFTLVGF